MDLGLNGRTAVVCASSRGLGRACARALAGEGVHVVMVARDPAKLTASADSIRGETGGTVVAVAADLWTDEGRALVLEQAPAPDILVTSAGGSQPHGGIGDWGRDDWNRSVEHHLWTPVALIRAVIDGMCDRRFGRIVNITSGIVKMPKADEGLANGARLAFIGFIGGLARQVAQYNVTINNLLPGAIATDRLIPYLTAKAKEAGITVEQAQAAQTPPAGRFGEPKEFGDFCAFLSSRHAGFITGQSIAVDGRRYPGTL